MAKYFNLKENKDIITKEADKQSFELKNKIQSAWIELWS